MHTSAVLRRAVLACLLALAVGCGGRPPGQPSPADGGQGPVDSGLPTDGGTSTQPPAGGSRPQDGGTSGSDAGALPPPEGGSAGVPVNGAPSWRERTVGVFTNAVRMAPLDYRARFGADFTPSLAGALGAYPAVPPLAWEPGLGTGARAHSEDMARTPCFQHDSCDGTDWATRIRRTYTLSGTIGENIAAGYADPRVTVNQWLCDASGGSCCADGASCDGHRRNIMSSRYQAVGVGYAADTASPYEHYWTQDFGGAAPAAPGLLVDGSHALFPTGQTTFLANTYAPAAPAASVTLVLDGTSHAMAVGLGGAGQGTWTVALPRAESCRSYHFEATDSTGRRWRLPGTGSYRTTTEGGCAEEYVP